ncbi:hypothetical protein [Curtobacterium sp. MCPF17_046]|uniref:hypothetical protein n=1 Tax=Curtobacterium sp. MCPF17_046 TaxID=2175663 RepID=UPI0011B600AE|nr:hypothetical protein [Curtobacterium sp. MCPF17_046]
MNGTTGRLGAEWRPITGPCPRECDAPEGDLGAQRRHVVGRSEAGTAVGHQHVGTTMFRVTTSALVLVMIVTVITGCAEQPAKRKPPVDSVTAQRQMVDAVDDVTSHLGGTWKPRTGPDYAESCRLSGGEDGAQWVYLTGRTAGGDPERDAAGAADRWKAQGLNVERWGDAARPAVVGRGGEAVDSISLYAYPGNYTVQAVSVCFPGDADEL